MTFPVLPGNSASTGYNLTRSLRFRSSASASLNRTFGSPTNNKIWSLSVWVKRGTIGARNFIASTNTTGGSNAFYLDWDSDALEFGEYTGGWAWRLTTSQVFRDPSAWYHILYSVDTTQATASNRVKLYVNGAQVTAFSIASYPTQNLNTYWNQSGQSGRFGELNGASIYYDGYMTEVNFIDGQALTPSSFGSTNTLTGVWQPAPYTGTYGTNGFYLPFTDNSGITNLSTGNNGIGKDFSGNGNYWTTNNLSLYGGTVSSFTSVGTTTWTAPTGVTSVQYLVVGGGGGGGSFGGGGGGGGVVAGTLAVTPGASYTVTVGAGGAGGAGSGYNVGSQGSNSVFASVTAIGGGAGSSQGANAGSGGSGGGGAGTGSTTTGGAGTAGQGFAGGSGNGASSGAFPAGGGGGAGEAGKNFSGNTGGIGGAGRSSSISGSLVTYGGGGGGGANSAGGNPGVGGAGGAGGGGAGSASSAGTAGTANTGGGGGGGGNITAGGAGGSGIVILAYGSSVTYDSMTDVPTLTSATAANFAVLNPINVNVGGTATVEYANLRMTTGLSGVVRYCTIGMATGKYYAEFIATGGAPRFGVSDANETGADFTGSLTISKGSSTGELNINGTINNTAPSFSSTALVSIAYDADTRKVWLAVNGVWQNYSGSGADPATGTNPIGVLAGSNAAYFGVRTYNCSVDCNFGQRPFTYTPPTGFVALNTYNLPTSTIVKGNTVMDALLWAGNGAASQNITSGNFQPDFAWLKARNTVDGNNLVNSVLGGDKLLQSNTTNAEVTVAMVDAWLPNGVTVNANENVNTRTYVGWLWQAGQGTTSTNTSGSITSTVSVNASAGFSVVTYTGVGAARTVGHGLGVAPTFYIVKSRNPATPSVDGYWVVYSAVLGAGTALLLNTTNASNPSGGWWNSTAPTSSVFSVGTDTNTNANGTNFVAYCWTPIAGYSAFGSYTGNGSADGPMIYTGFRPKYVLVKCSSSDLSGGAHWVVQDSSRSTYNAADAILYPNLSNAEGSGEPIDLLSNGFKIRNTVARWNSSGATFIYMAFAENPFKNALAR